MSLWRGTPCPRRVVLASDILALEYSTHKYLLRAFPVSESPPGTWDIAVRETHMDPYPNEVYILVRTQNTDVPISGYKHGSELHKSICLTDDRGTVRLKFF